MKHYILNFTKKSAVKGTPLREQAARLLEIGLWGIGPKTHHKDSLAAGDRILAYVGAPEKLFIGQATLARGFHDWTPEEQAKYAGELAGGEFPAGVTFSDFEVWEKPVLIDSVWSQTSASETNPDHNFMSGIYAAITPEDFETVVRAAGGGVPAPQPQAKPPVPAAPETKTLADRLYAVAETLREWQSDNPGVKIPEGQTRLMFIDPLVRALGYDVMRGDVEVELKLAGATFADYVLKVDGKEAIVVEAKPLGWSFGSKEGAQVTEYANTLGVRWGLVTDGQTMKLYDRVPNLPVEKRVVFELQIADYRERADFDADIYPDLALMSKKAMGEGKGLEQRAAQQAIRDLLGNSESVAVGALTKELSDSGLAKMSAEEVAAMAADLLG